MFLDAAITQLREQFRSKSQEPRDTCCPPIDAGAEALWRYLVTSYLESFLRSIRGPSRRA